MLYRSLVPPKKQTKAMSIEQRTALIEGIENLDPSYHSIILKLIIHHYKLSRVPDQEQVPYKAKVDAEGNITFNLRNLPTALLYVLSHAPKALNAHD